MEAIQVPNFEAMHDPFPLYEELAGQGAVLQLKNHIGLPFYGIFDTSIAQDALRDPRFSKTFNAMQNALETLGDGASASSFPISSTPAPNLLNTDPPDHTRLRKLVNLTFSPKRVEVLRQQVEELVGQLIDTIRGKAEVDLVSSFSYPVGLTMICNILGVPKEDRDEFRHLATQTMRPGAPDQAACKAKLMEYLTNLVATKRDTTDLSIAPDDQPDVLSALCAARLANDALSEPELISMAFLLLIAGHETTVGLIGNAIRLFDIHRDQRKLLIEDEGLLRGAIEEVLRFDGPVHRTTMRATIEDIDAGGVRIGKGSFVQVFLAACNRDPAKFEDPNRFDITRKPSSGLAFGYGPHMCLGSHLARLEAQIAIRELLRAFPNYSIKGGAEAIEWAGTVVRAASYIPALPNGAH